jgi:hypothetical protein
MQRFRSIYFHKLHYMFQAGPPPIIRSTKLYIHRQLLSNQYWCLLLSWMRWNSREFQLIHDSSSIGSTIPDAVCTVLCSWWWAEELPETCRAIYRNKHIEKTLHLVWLYFIEIYLRCTGICTSVLPNCYLPSLFLNIPQSCLVISDSIRH